MVLHSMFGYVDKFGSSASANKNLQSEIFNQINCDTLMDFVYRFGTIPIKLINTLFKYFLYIFAHTHITTHIECIYRPVLQDL